MKAKTTRLVVMLLVMGLTGMALVTAQDAKKAEVAKAATDAKAADQAKEALAGFTNASNGFEDQDGFDKDRKTFQEVEEILPNGLGPVYNATSCVGCHQNPVTGSSSQNAELRSGHIDVNPTTKAKTFVNPPGGSLIHQRAIDASIQEHARQEDEVRTLRMSTSILGDGFVEVIPDEEIAAYASTQPSGLRGTIIIVPAAVSGTTKADGEVDFKHNEHRVGRFGWKCQEASLINFAAGAYLNEMGVTSPLQPDENTPGGRDVTAYDPVPDPEDKVDPKDSDNKDHPFGDDVKSFTRYMRSLRVPPRDFASVDTQDVKDGEAIFRNDPSLGCAVCHRPDYTTPKVGMAIHGRDGKVGSDMKTVPLALANKVIHPYSDFMLHDIGTGDGIVQAQHAQRQAVGLAARQTHRTPRPRVLRAAAKKANTGPEMSEIDPQETANMIRTAPLWGLRTRPQMMHDGLALTLDDAITRHKVDAGAVKLPGNYTDLQKTPEGKEKQRKLKAFLMSL